jgi:FixJ family two-component response regulator
MTTLGLPKIIVVDDESDNLSALSRLLRKQFDVLAFNSAEQALSFLKSQTHSDIDVVVSDQRMPGLTGFEFLEIVKDINPFITRILITGFSDLEAVTLAINKGEIWRYIAKPWEPSELISTLQQAAERTQTQRKLQLTLNENQKQIEELKAKEWSRHYLFKILLHEFRTAPQVLLGAIELSQDQQVNKFIQSVVDRFGLLESEISDYIEFEKSIATQTRSEIQLTQALGALSFLTESQISNLLTLETSQLKLNIHKDSFISGIHFYYQSLKKNTAKANPKIHIEISPTNSPQIFLYFEFEIESTNGEAILPEALGQSGLEATVAWRALFEPFIGTESLLTHSKGFRLEAARWVRILGAQGLRHEVAAKNKGQTLVFTCSIPLYK